MVLSDNGDIHVAVIAVIDVLGGLRKWKTYQNVFIDIQYKLPANYPTLNVAYIRACTKASLANTNMYAQQYFE